MFFDDHAPPHFHAEYGRLAWMQEVEQRRERLPRIRTCDYN
ncbi:MAG: DUF4160 domain-containing protein [Methylobacter sp.]|nr:DUF4160 domain-containing protein [Methylobacter sp.]